MRPRYVSVLLTAVFAWWVVLVQHPGQPIFGPYDRPADCLRAALRLSNTFHKAVDCVELEVMP